MTPSQVGERAEAAVIAALTAAGHRVLLPFGQDRYDLAYMDKKKLVRVQVKCGQLRNGALAFYTHKVNRKLERRDYREDADVFAIYCHERGEVYLVPVEDVPLRGAHLRLDPPKNGQNQKIRWAAPYLFSRVPTPQLMQSPALPPHRQLSILTDIDVDASLGPMQELEQFPIACCAPLSEATISPHEADAAATLFKALADPSRVLILNRLLACGDAVCVCELNEDLDLSQPTVSFHLKKLVAAGLLAREQRGTWAYFSVVPEAMEQLSQLFKTKESV
jgi:ArsR family transcriptional regulator